MLGLLQSSLSGLRRWAMTMPAFPMPASWTDAHVGRSWVGHPLEDDCPCPKAPCGLVPLTTVDPACPQHPVDRCKTIRQAHQPKDCPGAQ